MLTPFSCIGTKKSCSNKLCEEGSLTWQRHTCYVVTIAITVSVCAMNIIICHVTMFRIVGKVFVIVWMVVVRVCRSLIGGKRKKEQEGEEAPKDSTTTSAGEWKVIICSFIEDETVLITRQLVM